MKKVAIILAMSLAVTACSKDETNEPEAEKNPFIGNSYTGPDQISEIIYGKGATITVEFINETEVQELQFRPNSLINSSSLDKGTYTFSGNSVRWNIEGDDRERTAELSGSVLKTRLYTLQKD